MQAKPFETESLPDACGPLALLKQSMDVYELWKGEQRKGLVALQKLQDVQAAMTLQPPPSNSPILQQLQRLAPSLALDRFLTEGKQGHKGALSDYGDALRILYNSQERSHAQAQSLTMQAHAAQQAAESRLASSHPSTDQGPASVSRMLQAACLVCDLAQQVELQTRIQAQIVAVADSAEARHLTSYVLVWDLAPSIDEDVVAMLRSLASDQG